MLSKKNIGDQSLSRWQGEAKSEKNLKLGKNAVATNWWPWSFKFYKFPTLCETLWHDHLTKFPLKEIVLSHIHKNTKKKNQLWHVDFYIQSFKFDLHNSVVDINQQKHMNNIKNHEKEILQNQSQIFGH